MARSCLETPKMASRHVYFSSLNFLAKLMRPKVTCLLEVCFRNSSLDMILSGVAWDKKNHVWPRNERSRLRPCEVSRLRLTWVMFGLGEKPSTKRDLRHQNMNFGATWDMSRLGSTWVTFEALHGHVLGVWEVTFGFA
ncbi:hypothetical protein PIB30_088296 [Stylosanthes scabra]|uniref:Uncharacterized protein n=1 Tax=Stylosanthes scabra TaxID=79078 RepID=A0ABU6ZSE5_9FABA|nr:hypothetical protein [Stylosanthes scabra]